MKKPSERIKEISKSKEIIENGTHDREIDILIKYGTRDRYMVAIVKYLDEEYEKNKPCEHKNNYRDDLAFYDVCKDCGVIGSFS